MNNIQIQCDRCGKMIDGKIDKLSDEENKITEGFYIVSEGNWKEFQRWEEEYVCDECMHSDPKYRMLYQYE